MGDVVTVDKYEEPDHGFMTFGFHIKEWTGAILDGGRGFINAASRDEAVTVALRRVAAVKA